MTLGEKIINLRKSRTLSQEQLGERLGVSRQAVSKWELNESVPDVEKVVALSRMFGVTTDYLIIDEQIRNSGDDTFFITEVKAVKNTIKSKKLFGWLIALLGVFVITAIANVILPFETPGNSYEGGIYWLNTEGNSVYISLIRDEGLGLLIVLLGILMAVGLIVFIFKLFLKVRKVRLEKKEAIIVE